MLPARNLHLFDEYINPLNHPLADSIKKLLLFSDYACRQIQQLLALLQQDNCLQSLTADDYFTLVSKLEDTHFPTALRLFRHRHFLRLILREIAALADTIETMNAWSACADAMILAALGYCQRNLHKRYGSPQDERLQDTQLYTIAMGKLGGRELNFSSDIDLIFTYSCGGYTVGPQCISNHEYYTKLVQSFIQLMQRSTEEEFVFRVDLRLRPNGDSGALVCSLAALENYYQERGRDWERYAMIKARVILPPGCKTPTWFAQLIIPFVYRRYLDFSVLESLRSMKAMIIKEIQLNPMLNDIKRGLGGIREIEFIVQCLQLIRGGKNPKLRQESTLDALQALQEANLLPKAKKIEKSYLFLRQLENYLQGQNNQQIHSLPTKLQQQKQIILVLKFNSWQRFIATLKMHQYFISSYFKKILTVANPYESNQTLLVNQVFNIWQGNVEKNTALHLLQSLGFDHGERFYQLLTDLRGSSRFRSLKPTARIRVDRFIILLMLNLIKLNPPETILLQVFIFIDNVIGRSIYLSLLAENEEALLALLFWFKESNFLATLLTNHPFLLENLLEDSTDYAGPNKVKALISPAFSHNSDILLEEELRQYKLNNWFKIARSELRLQIDAIHAGLLLSNLASDLTVAVFELACAQLSLRFPRIVDLKPKIAIVAYGKLGSQEMNYHSDLDLVFIHDTRAEDLPILTQLVQRIISILHRRHQHGMLYEVDMRLRPSGSAGLLVTSMPSFIDYQHNKAWIWEHQAFLKARLIYGNKLMKKQFLAVKRFVFKQAVTDDHLKREVIAMREKIKKQSQHRENIKHMAGGLIDLEFLVQYLLLASRPLAQVPSPNTKKQIQQLWKINAISQSEYVDLINAYHHYYQVLHHHILQGKSEDVSAFAEAIQRIWQRVFLAKEI